MKWFELLYVPCYLDISPPADNLCIQSMFIFQNGMAPLIAACEGGHSATAQLLIEKGADMDKQDNVRI